MKTARMASSHSSRLAVTNRTLRSTEMVSESGVVGGGAAGGGGAAMPKLLSKIDSKFYSAGTLPSGRAYASR